MSWTNIKYSKISLNILVNTHCIVKRTERVRRRKFHVQWRIPKQNVWTGVVKNDNGYWFHIWWLQKYTTGHNTNEDDNNSDEDLITAAFKIFSYWYTFWDISHFLNTYFPRVNELHVMFSQIYHWDTQLLNENKSKKGSLIHL